MLLHALRGEADACFRHGQQAYQDMMQNSAPSHRRVHLSDVLAVRARAAWLLGDADSAAPRRPAAARGRPPLGMGLGAALPRLEPRLRRAARRPAGRGAPLLEPMAHDIERYRYYAGAQARFMLADIHARQGALDAAAALLRPWLQQVLQGGDVGGALFAGAAVLQRLAGARWGGRLDGRRRSQLLRPAARRCWAGPRAAPEARPPAGVPASAASRAGAAGLDDLTEREREVLERIAAGDSNKLIARAFQLSPHTVKRHVANILDKLGVDTRGQAAARWRQQAADRRRRPAAPAHSRSSATNSDSSEVFSRSPRSAPGSLLLHPLGRAVARHPFDAVAGAAQPVGAGGVGALQQAAQLPGQLGRVDQQAQLGVGQRRAAVHVHRAQQHPAPVGHRHLGMQPPVGRAEVAEHAGLADQARAQLVDASRPCRASRWR